MTITHDDKSMTKGGTYELTMTKGGLKTVYTIGRTLSGDSVYIQSKSKAATDTVYFPVSDVRILSGILSDLVDTSEE